MQFFFIVLFNYIHSRAVARVTYQFSIICDTPVYNVYIIKFIVSLTYLLKVLEVPNKLSRLMENANIVVLIAQTGPIQQILFESQIVERCQFLYWRVRASSAMIITYQFGPSIRQWALVHHSSFPSQLFTLCYISFPLVGDIKKQVHPK